MIAFAIGFVVGIMAATAAYMLILINREDKK